MCGSLLDRLLLGEPLAIRRAFWDYVGMTWDLLRSLGMRPLGASFVEFLRILHNLLGLFGDRSGLAAAIQRSVWPYGIICRSLARVCSPLACAALWRGVVGVLFRSLDEPLILLNDRAPRARLC